MLTISLITPVRNAVDTIPRTLESVESQSSACLEHCVLDANSSDGTSEYLASRANGILHHMREPDAGLYDAMNKGIHYTRGEIIGIINADDFLLPGALEAVVRAFQDPSVDFVYGDVEVIHNDGTSAGLFPTRERWVSGQTVFYGRDWRYIVPICHPGLFVRRSTYERIGVFDTRFRLAADHEFICRLIASKAQGKRIHRALAAFRLGGASSYDTALFAEDERIAVEYGLHPFLARLNRWRSSGGRVAKRMFRRTLRTY